MLTPSEINEHITKRNNARNALGELSPSSYIPLVDTAANAMVLFSFFGNYTWKHTLEKPEDFTVDIRFAFKCDSNADDYERDKQAKKIINSMRSALANVRNSLKVDAPDRKLSHFKMLFRGHTKHTRTDILIISLSYSENETRKTVKKIFNDLLA
jgi:hypothetical protein